MNNRPVLLTFLGWMGLAFIAFVEVLFGMPAVWWLYVLVIALLASGLLLWEAAPRPREFAKFGVALAVLATLYFVPWNSRKPFLRDLYSLRPGMTEAEVRKVMGRYMEGTGWPAVYGGSPAGTGVLVEADTGATHTAVSIPTGELAIKNSLVFRHSTDGAFNSDWGIVNFEHGKVTDVSFSPD